MKTEQLGYLSTTAISVMRNGEVFGSISDELEDGNMIPRLCIAAGEGACQQTCQIDLIEDYQPKMCAEENINQALEQFGVHPENFLLVAATEDRVVFGDDLEIEATHAEEGEYSKLPACNAFFFRPGIDKLPNGQPLHAMGMRMADCGSVNFEFRDANGDLVVGQSHFSRTNMHGPSAFKHDYNSQPASWGETVIGSAIDHYGANPKNMKVKLSSAVERDDFIHHYSDLETMENHFPGWAELGFMHPVGDIAEGFDCEIDYREMIGWQLDRATEHFGLDNENIETEDAINTGDITLGHASHHKAHSNDVQPGRDLYITGINPAEIEKKRESARLSGDDLMACAQFEDADDYYAAATALRRILG